MRRRPQGAIGDEGWVLPNGSRLSCGRSAGGRKEVERQTKRLVGEATQFFPTWVRPPASSACQAAPPVPLHPLRQRTSTPSWEPSDLRSSVISEGGAPSSSSI